MQKEKDKFEFVYVESDGTIRELDNTDIEYLQTEFEPFDGARPYIKSDYKQLTPDKKISGFLHRNNIPRDIKVINTNLRYAEIRFPIRIHDSNQAIALSVGVYSINVLGGWSVFLGNFSILLINKKGREVIIPKVTNWRIQSYELGERAKRIMTFEIKEPGVYFIEFKNPKDLKVRRSNLFLMKLFENEIPNNELNIWIDKK
ncbi:hypothetical protein [Tenacibaculum jejuense]|uniref:Uncharacterized protein n=1 Tax=Tenacibaculum jejuense TaxID=584609 RepID=A0A238U574_9FLAO|nr:hypothetical protein [Tenacibaculum jejuense]SNR14185.1 conserved protein of unknown function [Tenacibaculum jejuense]